MGHCIHRQIIMVIKMNNFNNVNDSNIACQIQMRLFCIILYLINVASSTPLATMKLHCCECSIQLCNTVHSTGPSFRPDLLKMEFWFCHKTPDFANLQSGGKFAKSCETTRLQFSAACCSHGPSFAYWIHVLCWTGLVLGVSKEYVISVLCSPGCSPSS